MKRWSWSYLKGREGDSSKVYKLMKAIDELKEARCADWYIKIDNFLQE